MRMPGRHPLALALLLAAALGGLSWLWLRSGAGPSAIRPPTPSSAELRRLAAQLTALEAQENQVAETVWAKELVAQRCGQVLNEWWDEINGATNKLELAAAFPVGEVQPPKYDQAESLAHGIQRWRAIGLAGKWSASDWRGFVEKAVASGWQLVQTEFRHNRFETDAAGQPKQSEVYFSAHLLNSLKVKRAILEGNLVVGWSPAGSPEVLPTVAQIETSQLQLRTRTGEPVFRPVLQAEIAPPAGSHFIDPLIVCDLDGDGLSEIVLAAKNLVFRRHHGDSYSSEPFCRHSPGLIFTGVIADFDRDGAADFLCARFEGMLLFKGTARGTFDEPGRLVWRANPHLKYAQVLTCGDLDEDGDLDVWLGQYKLPYERGQMPVPYYDANDGNPAYLLLNDGQGTFTDGTEAAGLGPKRWRRTYSGSLVDLDSDGDLDLVVVSDFAGVDVYANDGRGHFTDLTQRWIPEPHGFGMAHLLADLDVDGRLDFFMVGMHCPTARRLDRLNLARPERPDYETMRGRMTEGNRLFRGVAGGGFEPSPLNPSIGRSGWSWGCTALDFDNDGFPDVYIGTGHESRQFVRDYEPEFWLHDLYVGKSKDDVVASAYFGGKSARTRGQGWSYGGYEKNRLFWNRAGQEFLEVGYLLGVGLEQDSRNVVADDLDGDGRMDLLVTTFEVWPRRRQTLQVFRNSLGDEGNWIGFRLREEGDGRSPAGARVALSYGERRTVRDLLTGDSYRSQHANTIHFGLGGAERVELAEIRWGNGAKLSLRGPAINRYHEVRRPAAEKRN